MSIYNLNDNYMVLNVVGIHKDENGSLVTTGYGLDENGKNSYHPQNLFLGKIRNFSSWYNGFYLVTRTKYGNDEGEIVKFVMSEKPLTLEDVRTIYGETSSLYIKCVKETFKKDVDSFIILRKEDVLTPIPVNSKLVQFATEKQLENIINDISSSINQRETLKKVLEPQNK